MGADSKSIIDVSLVWLSEVNLTKHSLMDAYNYQLLNPNPKFLTTDEKLTKLQLMQRLTDASLDRISTS